MAARCSLCTNLLIISFSLTQYLYGQTPLNPQPQPPYSLKLSVDEVSITFHASDSKGLPVDDLKPEEIDFFDNGLGPRRILSLEPLQSGIVRIAILVDTSGSVAGGISHTRAMVALAVKALFRNQSDLGLMVEFGRSRNTLQSWTKDIDSLVRSAGKITPSPSQGTSLHDAILSTCFHELGAGEYKSGRNVLLVFTDGYDTDSYVTSQEAADACQRTSTAIYAFDTRIDRASVDSGAQTLRQLVEQTGGRFFSLDKPDSEVKDDLRIVQSDLVDGYRLIYRPSELKRDGSFHRIALVGPARVATIAAVSGFYAPKP